MNEPTRTLSPTARWVWRVQAILFWVGALVVAATVLRRVDETLSLVAMLVGVVALVGFGVFEPQVRWKRWRWEVRPEAIDIRQGVLVVRRTLIPLVRVQHVDTTRGVIEQALDLATVVVHTAAGSHKIPLLAEGDADELREHIAELARTADEP